MREHIIHFKMKRFLIILFTLFSLPLFAQHWWVDNTGTGDTLATIAEVNALGSGAGDTISFKKECEWRGVQLTVPGSGSAGSYVVYNSYGTGDKPKIFGSLQAITWTAEGHANIWQSATSVSDPNVGDDQDICFVEPDDSVKWGTFGAYSADFANLTGEYYWTWNANTVYVYAATDPDSRYTSVEVQQIETIIDLNNKDYIKIDNLELAYSVNGVKDRYAMPERTGITVSNCHIHHMGCINLGFDNPGYGIHVCYNNMLIEYNIIHDTGRRGCCIYNYMTDSVQHIVVHDNEFYDGTHTTGLDMSSGSVGNSGGIDSIWIYNNYVHDKNEVKPWVSVSMYIDGSGTGTGKIHHLWFYNNIMVYESASGLRLSEIYDAYVYNNTFYESNTNYSSSLLAIDYGGPIKVKNNIFYTTQPELWSYEGSCIQTSNIASNLIDANYNLVYRPDVTDVAYLILGTSYSTSEWADIKTDLGWELNSPNPADPLFINVTLPMEVDSLMIDALSPAVDAGIGVGINTDYRDSLRDENPDIGAYEYGGTNPDIPPDPPTISTNSVNIIYTRLARCGGDITDDGGGAISDRGICWSTSVNPTVTGSHIHIGTGDGAFSGYLEGLSANTTYYVRSFCYNESSEDPYYGGNETLTTPVHSVAKTGGKIVKIGGKTLILH